MKKTLPLVLCLLAWMPAMASATDEHKQLDAIEVKYRAWILGSEEADYHQPQIQARYKSIIANGSRALKAYKKLDLSKTKPYKIANAPKSNQKELRNIFADVLYPLAYAYELKADGTNPFYKDPEVGDKLLSIYRYLERRGFARGLDMGYHYLDSYSQTGIVGFGGSMGNNLAPYSGAVFLNKDLLKAHNMFAKHADTVEWVSDIISTKWDGPNMFKHNGFNLDAVRSLFNSRFIWVLIAKPNEQRLKEAKFIARIFNKSLQIAPGWADFIKPDFTGSHHKNAYINAYGPGAFHVASVWAYMFDDTFMAVDETAIDNLAQGLLSMRLLANKYDTPRLAPGRFPNKLDVLIQHMPAFAYAAPISSNFSTELRGALARLWEPNLPVVKRQLIDVSRTTKELVHTIGALELLLAEVNKTPSEATPEGFWRFPYAGLAMYRKADWNVSWRGISNFVWDFESSSTENLFGRFIGTGVMVHANGTPTSLKGSGYDLNGWHWARTPGATTLDLTVKEVKKTNKRAHRKLIANRFMGSLAFTNQHHVASSNYEQLGLMSMDYQDPYSSLRYNQTVLVSGDDVLVLNTDIHIDESEKYDVQTTVFQLNDNAAVGELSVLKPSDVKSKTVKTSVGRTEIYQLNQQGIGLVDTQGHAYWVDSSMPLEVFKGRQTSRDDRDKRTTTGDFTSARLLHSKPDSDSMSYTMRVNGGSMGAESLQKSKPFTIVSKADGAHIINGDTVTAYALFGQQFTLQNRGKATEVIRSTDSGLLALVRILDEGGLELAISKPDMGKPQVKGYEAIKGDLWFAPSKTETVNITLDGEWNVEHGEGIQVNVMEGITTISAKMKQANIHTMRLKAI